jgi:hypothetical protein
MPYCWVSLLDTTGPSIPGVLLTDLPECPDPFVDTGLYVDTGQLDTDL